MTETKRIAVWSGPRNLSTALMYAFGQRDDCRIVDEPFYASYLSATGLKHPMREEILAAQKADPAQVAEAISAPLTCGKYIQYLKLMTHHLLPTDPRDWMSDYAHVLLIRHPARVLASYAVKREAVTLEDIGFPQQAEIYRWLAAQGRAPVIVDSADIRANPQAVLTRLCTALGISFDRAMLSWPKGGHTDDGIWASHWYDAVHDSTGFAGAEGPLPDLSGDAADICARALPIYAALAAQRI